MKTTQVLVIVLSFFFSSYGYANQKDWLGVNHGSLVDNTLFHTNSILMVADYLTTMDIRRHPELREKNNWASVGRYLKRSDVNKHFFSKGALHYFINTNIYTRPYKSMWNTWQIGLQYNAINGNLDAGLSFNF